MYVVMRLEQPLSPALSPLVPLGARVKTLSAGRFRVTMLAQKRVEA
ncbi:MAG: hypothetical protein JWQ04_233, partial [Pedosphaera sp.]|nr:hypothetical protein [Pedosphaera sp.]